MTDSFDQIPMAPHRRAARGRHLVTVVAEQSTPSRRGVLRWAVPGAVTALMLTGGVAVAAYVVSQQATVREQVHCYTEANVNGYHSDGAGATAEGKPADIADEAVSLCRQLWEFGVLTEGPAAAQAPPPQQDPKAGRPAVKRVAPPLVACVVSDGVAGVFPGDASTCARLNLPELRKLDR
ncbi:hypothetical protein ACWEIJ_31125 [Lentzea sp. NPDC004789]